jgi:hypothetical protein
MLSSRTAAGRERSRPWTQPEESGLSTVVIRPSRGLFTLYLAGLWQYRELLGFLIWRDVKVRYKQTLIGAAWAVLQPLLTMAILTAVFGRFARIPSDGVPYPLFAFAAVTAILLHPRVFTALARVIFRRFDAPVPPRLPYRILVGLLGYYAFTWLVGGTALYLLLRSLDADPGIDTIPYLGGAAAIGAIVAVLTVFAPSGLGVREASMYGLLVVVVPASAALGATVLNRLAITLVEAALLGGGVLVTRLRRSPAAADGEVDERAEEREQDRGHDPDGLLAAGDVRVPEHADERGDDEDERGQPHHGVEPVDHV